MIEGIAQVRSRLVVAGDHMKALGDAGTIDAERDVRKLAQGIRAARRGTRRVDREGASQFRPDRSRAQRRPRRSVADVGCGKSAPSRMAVGSRR